MPAHLQAFLALEAGQQVADALADFFKRQLTFPLEGGVRLGHEGRDGSGHLQAADARPGGVTHLAAQVHDGVEVLARFGGQADHEIQLHLLPAVLEQLLHVQQPR